MRELVFLMCGATSAGCAFLLLRMYLRTRTSLLLWSTLCFMLFTVNNVLLVIDLIIFPDNDLSLIRSATAMTAFSVMLFGLIWEVAE